MYKLHTDANNSVLPCQVYAANLLPLEVASLSSLGLSSLAADTRHKWHLMFLPACASAVVQTTNADGTNLRICF